MYVQNYFFNCIFKPNLFSRKIIIMSGIFRYEAIMGNLFLRMFFYERPENVKNNCIIMIPNYYSYYYSNSTTVQSINMSSQSSSMNYMTTACYSDPMILFSHL
jgi:hypothetical protein